MDRDEANANQQQEQPVMDALTRLDAQYNALSKQQQVLLHILDKLQREESCLVRALATEEHSSTGPRPTLQRQRDQEAVSRLEQALKMAESSSSEEEDGDVDVDVDDDDDGNE